MKFFERLKYNCLLKQAKKDLSAKRFHNLQSALNVGIIFNCNEDFDVIQDFKKRLVQYDISLTTLCYNADNKQNVQTISDYIINRKDINFLGCVPRDKLLEFIRKEFDILILASLEPVFTILYIFAITPAALKVSPLYPEWNFADLTLRIRPEENLEFFFSNIEKYLLEIQTSK